MKTHLIMYHFARKKLDNYILDKVMKSSWSLKHLDPQLFTTELLEVLLSRDYNDSLRYVAGKRDELINESLVEKSLAGNMSMNYQYIPDNLKTGELSRKAIYISLDNLKHVPNRYILIYVMDVTQVKYRDGTT
jgi:hypothetical protein